MKSRFSFGLLCLLLSIGIFMPKTPLYVVASLGDYFEDFEGTAFSAWTATGLWHVENYNYTSDPLGGIPSDSKYAWYGNATTETYETFENNTETINSGDLISDKLDLTVFTGQTFLTFWSWADTESGDNYDQKNIALSIDGGATWLYLGNVVTDGEPMWQLIYFDISSFTNSSNVYIKFSFDTVDSVANDYRGWCIDDISITTDFQIPEYFELWIYQDYYARVGETRWMDFVAESYFNHTMQNVTIGIAMTGPSINSTLFLDENVYMPDYGFWNISLDYTFPLPGHYDVYFYLIDDVGTIWDAWCYWEVEEEHFYLWIDQEYFGLVGNSSWMFFYVESYFAHDMNVTIKIEMIGPSITTNLFYDSSVFIPSGNVWTINLDYIFPETGYYDVHLLLIDDIGAEWDTWCWVQVFEEPEFLWLQIYQDNFAEVDEEHWMDFQIYSNYTYNLPSVEIYAEITTPTSGIQSLFWYTNVTLLSQDTWWTSTQYIFSEPGSYYVFFYVTLESGEQWSASCWWEVYDKSIDDVEMWIEQGFDALIGEEVFMGFHVKTHFPDPLLVNIEIAIEKDGALIFNDELLDINLEPEVEWYYPLYYIFDEPGYYDVFFYMEDAYDYSVNWDRYCWWNVHGENIGIFIDSDYNVYVGEPEYFGLGVTNFFNETQDFSVNVFLVDDQENEVSVFSDFVYNLNPGSTWKGDCTLNFNTTGHYKLRVIISIDSTQFFEEIEFDVYSDDPTTTTDDKNDTTTVPTLSPGFELFLMPLVIFTVVYLRKRQ